MSTLTRRSTAARAAAAAAVTLTACARDDRAASADSAAATTAAAVGDTGRTGAAGGATYARVATVQGFKTPESVNYDPDQDVYFVSNVNGNPSQKDNNGFISRVRPDGTVDSLAFIAGGRSGVTLNAPKGSAIVGDTLAVADIDAVRLFNTRTGAPIASVDLRRLKARFLNDVAVGPDGALYVTDTGVEFGPGGSMSHPGTDQIFKIVGRTPSVAASGAAFAGPNGIAFDRANGRFVVTSFTGQAVGMWKAGDAQPGTLAGGVTQTDGVAVLGDGRVLVSSWADSSITALPPSGAAGSGTKVVTGVPSPADFGVDTKRNRLLVPIFTGDRVEIFEMR